MSISIDKIGIYIKKNLRPVYELAETLLGIWVYLANRKSIRSAISQSHQEGFFQGESLCIRQLKAEDITALSDFLNTLPESHLVFFRPHGFSKSALWICFHKPHFLMYGLFQNKALIGYALLKLFPGKKAFRGRIISQKDSGKGLGKLLSRYLDWQMGKLGFLARSTISRHNLASLKSHTVEGNFRVIDELEDDYILIEFLPTPDSQSDLFMGFSN